LKSILLAAQRTSSKNERNNQWFQLFSIALLTAVGLKKKAVAHFIQLNFNCGANNTGIDYHG
jgi:hypothetical protein